MAKRPTFKPQSAVLRAQDCRLGAERLRKRIEALDNFDPASVTNQSNIPEMDSLAASIEDAVTRTFGPNTVEYHRYRPAAYLDNGPFNYLHATDIREVRESLARSKAQNLALLRQAVESLEERASEAADTPLPSKLTPSTLESSKVFVVHGRDDGAREAVSNVLLKLGLKPVILHEQANQGRTIIEKIEANSDVRFAVVLLTPDDVGGMRDHDLQPRARQNVLLELGYFVGLLGRKNVCALKRGELELPSDFGGVVYTSFDDRGAWAFELARELRAAGYAVDTNQLI